MIDALAPRNFGARVLGPVYLAHGPDEPNMWITIVDRTLLPRAVDVSRFMAALGGMLVAPLPGCVPLVLVDRESDFCVVGHRVLAHAKTVAQLAENGPDLALAHELGRQLARSLAVAHRRGVIHGLVSAATVLQVDREFLTWQGGIAGACPPDRLAPRLRPFAGDAVAPELRSGAVLAPATDVFGWGAVVAALLTGRLDAEAVAQVCDERREDPWWSLVRSCVDPVAKLRPPHGSALLDAVERCLAATRPAEADEFGEASFADLNEPDLLVAVPVRAGAHAPTEIVDEVDLGAVLDEHERASEDDASRFSADTSDALLWRELAERYLAEADGAPEDLDSPAVHDADPPIVGPMRATSSAAGTAGLGRVALVRVRTGPVRVVRADPDPVAGEFVLDDTAVELPPPPVEADAPALPLATGEEEDDWPDDVPAFDLDELGEAAADPTATGWNDPTPVDGLGSPRWHPLDEPRPSLRRAAGLDEEAATLDDGDERVPAPRAAIELAGDAEAPFAARSGELPELEAALAEDSLEAALREPVTEISASSTTAGTVAPPSPQALAHAPLVIPAAIHGPIRRAERSEDGMRRLVDATGPLAATSLSGVGVGRSGSGWALAIAILAGVLVVGVTLAGATRRGGLASLFAAAPAVSRGAPQPARGSAQGPDETPASPRSPSCPPTMALVPETSPPTCIDLAEYPGSGAVPTTSIDLAGAAAACRSRRARLCTQTEWRKACRGPGEQRHPYGARSEYGRCNVASPSGAAATVAPSGQRDTCTTAAGVLDLEGNVAEWVAEGFAMGGDVTTRGPSCETRTRPADDARIATLGLRCCVTLAGA